MQLTVKTFVDAGGEWKKVQHFTATDHKDAVNRVAVPAKYKESAAKVRIEDEDGAGCWVVVQAVSNSAREPKP